MGCQLCVFWSFFYIDVCCLITKFLSLGEDISLIEHKACVLAELHPDIPSFLIVSLPFLR